MMQQTALKPAIIAIFGATGDLTKRKLIPALYNLFLDNHLPTQFRVVAVGRQSDHEAFVNTMFESIAKYSRRGAADPVKWKEFTSRLQYIVGDFQDQTLYKKLKKIIDEDEREYKCECSRIYYLSVPPSIFSRISDGLGSVGLSQARDRDRIVIEKPFGRDLESSEELNEHLLASFQERQIYRIDHYLGKETVQNMFAFRFANALWEPIWNRRYVDSVQITVAEDVGVESRGGYYETSGALRDMVQNHLLQLMTIVAMEPLVGFEANEVRNKKVDVLKAVRPLGAQEPHTYAVRGQYGPGTYGGELVTGYRQEQGVDPLSSTETFVALKLYIDNWRWQDVPFYLRTGKRLPRKVSEIVIDFRPVPHQMFPRGSTDSFDSNRMVINIQPDEGISLRFQAKEPGAGMRLRTVSMGFDYTEAFHAQSREAYETLLQEVIVGDPALFMRDDQERIAWQIVQPLLDYWSSTPASNFPNYLAGTWGPEISDVLLARDGRSWHNSQAPIRK
jgi:glucose-6-phosphate 1-dehydrogenase